MIELTADDVAVILRKARSHDVGDLPVAQLSDEGQTEIVRWIESVGKADDQLSPYAWFSLAEEAAASHDPEEPILIEMLPLFTLSGEPETLELCRMNHFDWAVDSVPVDFLEDPEGLLDAGVPVRFLLLAEAAGSAFTERMVDLCPDLAEDEPQLLACAIRAFCLRLCDGAGIVVDDALLAIEEDGMTSIDAAAFDDAVEESLEAVEEAMLALDPELGLLLHAVIEPDVGEEIRRLMEGA